MASEYIGEPDKSNQISQKQEEFSYGKWLNLISSVPLALVQREESSNEVHEFDDG